jgi:V8-like Glu-specific endopeptidase
VLGLRLDVHGIMDAATRSAVRSFQQREGLPVDGVVGPETERALIAARRGQSPGASATTPAEPDTSEPLTAATPPPAAEFAFAWEPFDDAWALDVPAYALEAELAPPARQSVPPAPARAAASPARTYPPFSLEPIRQRTRGRAKPEQELESFAPIWRGRGLQPVSKADTTGLPHRWICYLREPNADPRIQSYGMGTGVLVGPRHVLTSAHVLVSEKDPSKTVGDRLRVQPARNGDHKPFREVGIRGWRVDPRWIHKVRGGWKVQARFDYGLVVLEKDVSGLKHPGLGACSLAYWGAPDICFPTTHLGLAADKVAGQEAWSAGYPGDGEGDREPGTMHGGAGQITYDTRLGVLVHTIDTYGGQSGSPIWIKWHGMWCLVGIHSRGGATDVQNGRVVYVNNHAVLVSFDVLRQVEEWKRSFRA